MDYYVESVCEWLSREVYSVRISIHILASIPLQLTATAINRAVFVLLQIIGSFLGIPQALRHFTVGVLGRGRVPRLTSYHHC